MAAENTLRRVTLGRLTPAELFERLSLEGQDSLILAEIICAMYWGGHATFNLQKVELLSESNWALAIEIMAYRRSSHWSEAQFQVIATWCRDRFRLDQWSDED